MTRKKVKLAWIVSDSARKASLRKRRQGLLKKVRELTVLCGVNAFIVIYGPENDRPSVWPSRHAVQQLLYRFHGAPEIDRNKKMTTQESYLKERVAKVQDQLRKQMKKNQELVTDQIMFRLSQGTQLYELETDDLVSLFWMTEEKMKETQKKIEYFQQVPHFSTPPRPIREIKVDGRPVALTENRLTAMDQWFIDMMINNKEAPGSSSASVYGPGSYDNGGRNVNGCNETGFTDYGGFGYNWSETTMKFPQGGNSSNGEQPVTQMGLHLPQDHYGLCDMGGLGEIDGEAAIGGGLPELESESYGGGAGAMDGNQLDLELPAYPENMDLGMGNENTGFLQGLFGGISSAGNDPLLSLDFSHPWHTIFSP